MTSEYQWPDSMDAVLSSTWTVVAAPLPVTKPFKTRVDLAAARAIIAAYRALALLDPSEVDLYEGDRLIAVPQKIIDDWKFTGLTFTHYIEDAFYKFSETP